MRSVVAKLWTVGALGLAMLTAGTARADAKGDELVRKVDAALKSYKTLTVQYDVTTQEPGRETTKQVVRSNMKGKKQLTELLAPGDIKGTKALNLSETEMYVYMPAFRKIRRVASHVNEGGFMGSTYAVQDMNLTQYAGLFNGTILGEDGGNWTLQLDKKPDAALPYSKLEVTVDKKLTLPTRIKYFDEKGQHIKTETRLDYACQQNVCTAKRQKMVDHSKGEKWTRLDQTEVIVNPDLPDDMFSKRSLQH
jgi:outer membrane lipoprotein-sorting protein